MQHNFLFIQTVEKNKYWINNIHSMSSDTIDTTKIRTSINTKHHIRDEGGGGEDLQNPVFELGWIQYRFE